MRIINESLIRRIETMTNEYDFTPVHVEWDEHHAILLRDFLNELSQKKIRYVILKNDDGLPYENHSKDVDIVIEPGLYDNAARVIQDCYKRHGITHYKIHKFERLRCWYGMNSDTHFAIHIDLLEGFLHKGFEMFPFETLYEHSFENSNGIRVLNELMGNVVLLLHSTICYHSIKDKYAKLIADSFLKQREGFIDILQQILGNKYALIMTRLLDAGDYKQIAQSGKRFSHAFKQRILLRRPFFSIYNVGDFLWEKACRLIFNMGKYNKLISVHAPDGTGKTTFIQKLGNELGFYYVCSPSDLLSIHHFRPCILPNLGAVGEKAGVMKQDTDFTNPHRAKPVNPISSFIRMTYYWLDYIAGMPLLLRKNAQFDNYTIFDRYVYDLLVDPERTRIKLPYWIRRIFARLVRKPKIIFVLNTDAETIYARKQELTIDEICRQLTEFGKLSKLGNQVHFLDASQTPDKIAADALNIVLNTFAEKLDNKVV